MRCRSMTDANSSCPRCGTSLPKPRKPGTRSAKRSSKSGSRGCTRTEGREAAFPDPVGLWRDVGHCARGFDLPANAVAVVSAISMDDASSGEALEEVFTRPAVGGIAARQHERERPTCTIRQGVDLRGAAAARATDRLIELPPFAPLAQRWAFTAELSRSTCAGGPPARARAWKMLVQTPFADHRTKRL